MAEYDGSIRIGTGIETKEFKAGSKEIETEARRMAKSVSDSLGEGAKIALQKQTDAFVKMNQRYADQEQKVKDLGEKLHELQRQKVETAEFKELSKDLDKAKASLDRLYDRRDSYVELGKKVPPKLDLDISDAERKIRLLEGDIKELQLTNKAYIPADTGKVQQELAMAEQKQMQMYTALQTAADSLSQKTSERVEKEEAVREKIAAEAAEEERLDQIRVNAVATNDQIIAKVERLKQLEKEIADLKAAGTTEGYADYDNRIIEADQLKQDIRDYRDSLSEVPEKFSRMREAAKKAFNAISTGLSTIGKIGKKAFSGIFSIAKKMFSSITSGTKKSNGLFSTFASRLKGIALSLLIFNWISKGFNAMISGMKKGFENLAGYSDSYAQSVQNMKNAMSTFGNQFAAAFAPIVQMVIPWLTQLINTLSKAMTYVAQFFAVLGGKSTFTKAKQVQDAYNKSLGGTAKAADKARGALAKFDDLDVLEKQEDTSGGGGDSENTGADMFEEAPIENSILDLFQTLKDFIYSEDWEGLGTYIASSLNTGLQKVYDIINWENVGPQITYFVTAFTSAFNGLVDGFDWDLLGKTIGAGINTMVNSLTLLISGIDWVALGAGLAAGLNGLANEVDFTNVGNLIGLKFMVLPSILLGFVANLDWAVIGTEIGNALNGMVGAIDLSQIGTLLGTGLTGLFQMAINFAATFDWKALGTNIYQGINSFFANTDWATVGQGISDFVMGILDTILVAVQGIDWAEVGRSIVDFILNIDWIGLAVKLLEIGVYLIGGLLEGILAALAGIGEWIKENVFDPIVNWFKELFGIHSPSTVFAEFGIYLMQGLLNGILDIFSSIGKWIYDHIFKPFIDGFKKAFGLDDSPVMEEMGTFIMEGLLGGIQSLVDTVVQTIKDVWSGIKEVFEGIVDFITGVFTGDWEKAWDGVTKIFDGIAGVIGGIVDGIIGVIKTVIEAIQGAIQKIKEFFSESSKASATGPVGGAFSSISGMSSNSTNSARSVSGYSMADIPHLATGSVIRGGNPFMAILGDQPRGQVNVEAPLDTIKQAVREELSGMNFGSAGVGQAKVVLNINGVDVGEAMLDDLFSVMQRRGYDVSVLGVR